MNYQLFVALFLCVLTICTTFAIEGKPKQRLQHPHGVHHHNKLYDQNRIKKKNAKKVKDVNKMSPVL